MLRLIAVAAIASVTPGMTAAQAYRQSSACLARQGFHITVHPGHGRTATWKPGRYGSWSYIVSDGKTLAAKDGTTSVIVVSSLMRAQQRVFDRCIDA